MFSSFSATILCPELEEPENGVIDYISDEEEGFEFGSVATYSCSEGFGLSGGAAVRTCGPDGDEDNIGKWSRDAPTCERKNSSCIIWISYQFCETNNMINY